MKVIVLYHPNSDHARSVETFQHDFSSRTGHDVELISLETVAGADKASVYDVTKYPAVMVTTDDGSLQKLWEGDQLPLIDEVSGYVITSS